ncbi:long-chain fatty acid--CoA ligase [Streptomyces sannanensis]|uniref:Long-chain fatty acid--CoA ligase n=1 Tax=Streptomyces sannanensis TaxID=285536 RepID=A0ABP6SMI4_9ACTN
MAPPDTPTGARWDFDPTLRLDALLVDACRRFGGSEAMSDGGTSMSFDQLLFSATGTRAVLAAAGIGPGSAVAVIVANRPGDIARQLGVWLAGATVVPLNQALPPIAVERVLRRSGARWILSTEDMLPSDWVPSPKRTMCLSGGLHAVTSEDDHSVSPVRADTALVAFSSGSTGEPKAIELSHAALANKLLAIQEMLRFGLGQRALHVLQLNFTFGQWTTLLTLLTGGVLEMMPTFSPRLVNERLAQGGIDRLTVVPTMLRMLLSTGTARPNESVAEHGGTGPALWVTGGEPLSPGLSRKIRHSYPNSAIADVYGLSETSTSDLVLLDEGHYEGAGAFGTVCPGVMCRIDALPGEAGEIQLKTPFLMSGYLGQEEATHDAVRDGWFRTGDLGRIGADGRIELIGRAKTLISRGAVKVSPLEIEAVYGGNPEWVDCLAVGVPDEVLGEQIHLVLAASGSSFDIDDLRAWGRGRLEPGKVPDEFHLVDELPLGETGKVDRRAAALIVESLLGKTGKYGPGSCSGTVLRDVRIPSPPRSDDR